MEPHTLADGFVEQYPILQDDLAGGRTRLLHDQPSDFLKGPNLYPPTVAALRCDVRADLVLHKGRPCPTDWQPTTHTTTGTQLSIVRPTDPVSASPSA